MKACTRAVRLHGVSTSIRLENLFWDILDEIAERDGMSSANSVTPAARRS